MEEFSVIIRAIMKHWLKLVIFPVLAAFLVHYLTKDQPKKYQTEAKLFMNLQENKAISLGESEMKQYQILTYFQNITELIKSEKAIGRVCINSVKLALEDSSVFKIGNEAIKEKEDEVRKRIQELEKNNFILNSHNPIDTLISSYLKFQKISHGRIADNITASRHMDSNFLKFSFTEEDPDKVYILSYLIIESLIAENRILAKSQINGHKALIQKLVDQAKLDLDIKVKQLENFKIKNNIINLGEYTKAIVSYLVNLEGQKGAQLLNIAASKKGKEEILATTKDGNELSVDLTSNQDILILKEKIKSLIRKKMLESFENMSLDSLDVIEKEIENTKLDINNKLVEMAKNTPYDPTRLQMELANRFLAYDLEIETSEAIIGALNEEIERAQKYSSRFAPFESTIGTMEQDIKTAQSVYLQLLNKLNITESLEYGSGENAIEIVDPPLRPEKPEPSKAAIMVGGAGIAVMVLFAGSIVILHLLDRSITSVKRFEKDSDLKVVSAIPFLKKFKKENLYTQSVQLIHRQQIIHLAKAIENNIDVVSNVVLFLSSQKEAGKHFLAEQVKTVMGSDSMRIAVIDADWTKDQPVEGFEDIRELLKDGATLLNEKKIIERVDMIRKQNDLVIIVVSPTNLIADYRFWTEHFFKVIYIFKAGLVWNKVDARFQKFILESGLDFIGTVLNSVEVEFLEDYIGDVPKNRNKIRILMKKLLKRDF